MTKENETLIGLEKAFYEIILQTNRIYNGVEQYIWELQDVNIITGCVDHLSDMIKKLKGMV